METRGLQIADSPSRRFAHGEVVLHQGEPSASLYLVRDGAVRLCAVLPSGREVVVGLLGAGDLFGESALAGPEPSPVEARTVGGVEVTALPVAGLHAALSRNPATAMEILRLLAARLHRTCAALEDALGRDVSTRLCRSLCELARRHGVPHGPGVRLALPLTQEDLGRMVGASREAVNRSLVALSRRGLVRTEQRRYVIPDLAALEGLGDDAVA
ncbi:MAG TPA: Crp/Fnr family transcriptional regulator [Actinomycetota bacterium]